MKKACHYSQTLVRMASLSMLALLFATPLVAQTDLEIMVSGPWAYVTKASDTTRIFLVAPKSTHHKAYIFPGTNAADYSSNQGSYLIGTGPYQLDFDQSLKAPYTPTPQDAPAVSSATVSLNKVSAVVSSASNYVISLPVPDDYSTYVDPLGQVDGYSEMKVGPNPQSSPPLIFTTWMVLHYSVKTLPASLQQTGTANKSIATKDPLGKAVGGISIVLGDPDLNVDHECDPISLESFNEQNSLWGLTGHARFPKQDKDGKQIHYVYNYHCSDSVPNMNALKRGEQKGLSAGGGDCHTHQISINKAGPLPGP